MSFTGDMLNAWGQGREFEEVAQSDSDYYREHSGEPVVVRWSKGYWVGQEGSGHPDDFAWRLRGTSEERAYVLGMLSTEGLQMSKGDLLIPVEGFITWQSQGSHLDESDSPWGHHDPPIGIEWLDAEPVQGEGAYIRISPIEDARDMKDARTIDGRVALEDAALDLDIGPSDSSTVRPHDRERFGAIDIAPGTVLTKHVLNIFENEDALMKRILRGDVGALSAAVDHRLKQEAATAARAKGEKVIAAREAAAEEEYWRGVC
jgi:hypothetical protein